MRFVFKGIASGFPKISIVRNGFILLPSDSRAAQDQEPISDLVRHYSVASATSLSSAL